MYGLANSGDSQKLFGRQARNPGGTVTYHDLNASRVPYMENDWIAGVYTPPDVERVPELQKALALSAELIAEL
jgi:FMN-dependent NADH-azoreductase